MLESRQGIIIPANHGASNRTFVKVGNFTESISLYEESHGYDCRPIEHLQVDRAVSLHDIEHFLASITLLEYAILRGREAQAQP
jgi:hypothetical protein